MNIQYFEDYAKMSRFAAEFVGEEIKTTQKDGGNFVLGLPTGSTPLGMYGRLAEMNRAGELDFSNITTFNLDEYYPIKRTLPQSYYKFMFDNFFGKINIDVKNINIPDGEAADADAECREYEKKIEAAGGIDLMVVGLGANGHIGFNEPGNYLVPYTHATDLTQDTREKNRRFFNSINEVPSRALTMGMGSILKAKKILMLVSGESKKEAFKKFFEVKIATQNPVSFLHLHRDVTVLADFTAL